MRMHVVLTVHGWTRHPYRNWNFKLIREMLLLPVVHKGMIMKVGPVEEEIARVMYDDDLGYLVFIEVGFPNQLQLARQYVDDLLVKGSGWMVFDGDEENFKEFEKFMEQSGDVVQKVWIMRQRLDKKEKAAVVDAMADKIGMGHIAVHGDDCDLFMCKLYRKLAQASSIEVEGLD